MSAPSEGNVSLGRFRELAEALRRGDSPDDVRASLEELVSGASTTLVVGPLLLELVAETTGSREARQLVEWFGVVRRLDEQVEAPCRVAGHPHETLRRENEALLLRVEQCRRAMQQLLTSADAFDQARDTLKELSDIDSHYRREEFLLFTRLEIHGFVRPGRVLWAAHDEIRQWLRYLDTQFAEDGFCVDKLAALGDSVVGPLLDDIEWMIHLEECVLLPLAREALNETDWGVVWEHSPKIGWCLVEPGSDYAPPVSRDWEVPAGFPELPLPTGVLNLGTLALTHLELPVDLTYIDSSDRVRYFTEGSRPVFYRSEAILGREVRCCHPPRSVHYVDQILSDFKSGRETSAQFWKRLGDRFIHIRFVALRDGNGAYLGSLEIAQDITHLQTLEGQQLELRYD